MPQATNVTVKNGATTPVDKTFQLVSPASGDGSLASWVLKEGAVSSSFPSVTYSSTVSGNGARTAKMKIRVPSSYVEAATGQTIVGPWVEGNLSVNVPGAFPEASKDDAIAFIVNLIGHNAFKTALRDAYPLT